MEQMTITAKIQIIVAEADKVLLDETMSVYRNACNYVSDYVFRTHDLKQFSLNKALYSTLREKFNLKSQMAREFDSYLQFFTNQIAQNVDYINAFEFFYCQIHENKCTNMG